MKKPIKKHTEVARVGRFGMVGVLNTLVDFTLLNILAITILPKDMVITTLSMFGLTISISGLILAAVISGTVAMICSFVFNTRFTFRQHKTDFTHGVYFFLITIFGLYVIRPIILKFVTGVWLLPGQVAYYITSSLNLPFSKEFDERNAALMLAVLVVLAYNYLMYKRFVFTNEKN